uniref:Nucleoporin SEH1 n=1 Tax=Globodera rostochiensis TaxID=31243 RepID=A0A914GY48_GLORO
MPTLFTTSNSISTDTLNGTWRKSASWKKHGGAVWKVRFAHPEYGQVLATCSFDNTIQIYDKDAADMADIRPITGADSTNGWVCRAVLRQSTASASITDIQLAPHYLGLQLAACTSSGRVIIYEAEDIMALDNWNVLHDYEVAMNRLSSLSWSTNRFDPPHLVVSSDDVNALPSEKVFLFRVNSGSGSTLLTSGPISALYADNDSDNADDGSITTEDGRAQTADETSAGTAELTVSGREVLEEGNAAQVIRLSWNVIGDVISAVHADGLIRVWRFVFSNRWILLTTITPPAEQDRNAKDDVYY